MFRYLLLVLALAGCASSPALRSAHIATSQAGAFLNSYEHVSEEQVKTEARARAHLCPAHSVDCQVAAIDATIDRYRDRELRVNVLATLQSAALDAINFAEYTCADAKSTTTQCDQAKATALSHVPEIMSLLDEVRQWH